MFAEDITAKISKTANILNIEKWDYGASFSNDFSVQVDRGNAKHFESLE